MKARSRPRVSRPGRRALMLGKRARSRSCAARHRGYREHPGRRPRVPARMRTANAIAKQGQARRGARVHQARRRGTIPKTRSSSPWPRRSSCARAPARCAFKLLNRRSASSPSSPTCYTTWRSPPRARALRPARDAHAKADRGEAGPRARVQRARLPFADRNLRLPEARKLIEEGARDRARGLLHHRQPGLGLYRQGDLKGRRASCAAPTAAAPDARSRALGRSAVDARRAEEARRIWDESLKAVPTTNPAKRRSNGCVSDACSAAFRGVCLPRVLTWRSSRRKDPWSSRSWPHRRAPSAGRLHPATSPGAT